MSDRISLVRWRDAKTDPPDPDDGWPVVTDGGVAMYVESEGQDLRPIGGAWFHAESSDYMDPQPSVWCDPSPPGDDAPTVGQLRRVCDLARVGNAEVWAHSGHPDTDQFKTEDTQVIDCLRRAIEEAER